ncbi:MAG: UDP-N-acetylmuramoyl-L-alanine--D-glutamate ligase [Planctomycetota bacterium]|jgi:UDP-N-acetylmuramoylalanine--D-glutamate ligase
MRRSQGTALILGLGRFGGGREAARFLHRRGWSLRIADRASTEELQDSVAALADLSRVDWALGREDEQLLEGISLLIANPAIKRDHPLLQAAAERGIRISQEVNLFLEHFPGDVVLVTGTNGKSTTSTLIAACLGAAGKPFLLGGNLGNSLLAEEEHWSTEQVAVLEISSFQLERIDPEIHRVKGCVLTRITVDHLDWHGNLDDYREAKARAAAATSEFLVHGAEDPVAASFTTRAAETLVFRGGSLRANTAAGWEADWLTCRIEGGETALLHANALELIGSFHRDNVAAAAIVALRLGVSPADAGYALCRTKPLPFRLQEISARKDIRLFDNSVSTELQSTLSALRSIPGPVYWVGGGKSKDDNYRRVAEAVAPHIECAHLFGAAAQPLAREFSGRSASSVHERLEDALADAFERAPAGSTILFSPAFASFDQFKNFRERGEAFHGWVRSAFED